MPSSRRRFFRGAASAGVVTVGALSVATIASGTLLRPAADGSASTRAPDEVVGLDTPVVAVLRDATTGEFALLAGEREIAFIDQEFAARVARAVARDARV